jgi:hypothetical protein
MTNGARLHGGGTPQFRVVARPEPVAPLPVGDG